MNYPSSTLWGTGVPRFRFRPYRANNPKGQRQANRVDDQLAPINMPATVDTIISFEPVRLDGGSVYRTRKDGTIVNRANAFRPQVIFSWKALSASEAQDVVRIINNAVDIVTDVNPHLDTSIWWEMKPTERFTVEYPDNIYIGHDIRVTFVATNPITEIPSDAADGTAAGGLYDTLY